MKLEGVMVLFIVAWADRASIATEAFTERFRAEERAEGLRRAGFLVTLDEYEF